MKESLDSLRQLAAQNARLKSFIFWIAALYSAAFLCLIVFFVLFVRQSGEDLQSSIAEGIPGFGQAVADVVRHELEQGKDLQKENMELKQRDEEMRRMLATSESKVLELDRRERELAVHLDRKRVELEEMRKLYEGLGDPSDQPAAESGKADADLDETALSEGGKGAAKNNVGVPEPAENKEVGDLSEALKELNSILADSGEKNIKIVGCHGLKERVLVEPTLVYQSFKGEKSVVVLPEQLDVARNGKVVEIRSREGGTFCPPGGTSQPLDEGDVAITFRIDSLDTVIDQDLRRLLGLVPLESKPEKNDPGGILARINALLERDKGREYRFVKIDSVEESCLRGVTIERYETSGTLKSSVNADRCTMLLYPRDRFLMLHFEDGTIGYGGKQTPFYDGKLNWNIPSIDPELWRGQAFAFLKED